MAGVFNVLLAIALAGPFQHLGVAVAALTTEIVVTLALFLTLRRHGLDPFARPAPSGAFSPPSNRIP